MDDLVLMRLLNKYRKNHINVYAGLRLTACDASAPRVERRAAQAVLSDPRSFERFLAVDGGPGSGNFGHGGRPGQVGGSSGEAGSSASASGSTRHKGTENSRAAIGKVEKALGDYEGIEKPNWGHAGEAAYIRGQLEEAAENLPASVKQKLKASGKKYPIYKNDPKSSIQNSVKRSREIMQAIMSSVESAESNPQEHEANFFSELTGGLIIPGRGYANGTKDTMDGGKGSGNFGHKGRPGQVGGSGGGGGSSVSSSSAKANRKSLDTANKKMSSECTKRAQQWPAGSQERHVYEMYAKILSDPLPERPTKEESDALTQKFLSNISTQLKPYAVERYKRDLANEPQITADLCDIADEVGAGMFGLGYRLKKASDSADGGCRIADKIAEDMKKNGWSYEEATDNLSDMVRYTQACTPENMVSNFEATRAALEEKGYKPVKIKNSWDNYSLDRPYRGVNCVFESPTGTKFELQFHTAESLVGKEVQHGQYEEQRDPRTAEGRKTELAQMMYNNMTGMAAPKDISKITPYP